MDSDARSNLQREVDRLADIVGDLSTMLATLQEAHAVQAAEVQALRLRVQHLEHGRSLALEQLSRQ